MDPAELGWSMGQQAAGRGAEQRCGCPATILGGGKGTSCQRARLDRETGRDAGDAVRAAAGTGVRARGVWERGVRCERGDARSVARGPSAECGGEREEAGLQRGPCGAGPSGSVRGPRWQAERGWRAGPRKGVVGCGFGLLGWAGWLGLGWVKGLGPVSFSILFQHTQTKLNSNSNLNSTLALNQIKEMLQHECNNKDLNL